MMDHALAAPVCHFGADSPASLCAELGGMGSQLQRSAPLRASKARTTPAGMSTLWLSLIAEPTITTSSITAGGEVMWYQPALYPGTSRRLISPPLPKSAQGLPFAASSAMSLASCVASKIRVRHACPAEREASAQAVPPRLTNPSP